jgi:hypothetical protein
LSKSITMEYFNNIKCVSVPELTDGKSPILSMAAYKHYVNRYPHVRVRRGSPAGSALLSWELLRDDLKARYILAYGDPDKQLRKNAIADLIVPDGKAAQYFASYELEDGRYLPFNVQLEYSTNASVLNALNTLVNNRKAKTRALGNSTKNVWPMASDAVNELDKNRYPHTLPANQIRLKDKLKQYIDGGYQSLIHRGYGNQNTRKVNDQIERLLISIYCMQNLPFGEWVHNYYMRFLAGSIEIIDGETGELYDRNDFYDENKGTYISISRATVWNVLNNPANEVIIDRMRSSRIDHDTKATPYNRRFTPNYSLSKISADDRTLPRKTTEGNWINAYYAFDVASGAVLSAVYSEDKPDVELVWECFRQMYRNLEENRLMWPIELEVENHLMRSIEQELKQMFGFVTFTNPGTSKSKRAEHFIHAKKYQDERRNQIGIGRWYSKSKAYGVKNANKDPEYKEPRLPKEQIIAEDKESIMRFNSDLHPDQKKFPGLTRWQVLEQHQNPDAGRAEKYKLFRFMGQRTETSIRNNDFVTVQHEAYGIDSFEVLGRLKSNNYKVEARYVRRSDGSISEVFLYQDDKFITRAGLIERYNEAKAERTATDETIRQQQAIRRGRFHRFENENLSEKVNRRVAIIEEPKDYSAIEAQQVPASAPEQDQDIDSLISRYTGGYYTEKSINDI